MPFFTVRRPPIRGLLAAAVLACAGVSPAGASAAGEITATATTGSTVNAVAAEASGKAILAGRADSAMLVQRVGVDGVPEPPLAAGGGEAVAVAVQPDGAIVVVGTDGGTPVVRRLTPDGVLDPAFGSGGTVAIPQLAPRALAVGPNGAIVVAGSAGADGIPRVALLRLLPSGAPDPAFSDDGLTVVDGAGRQARANGVVALPSGRIVFVGQRAPKLQVTSAIIGRVTAAGALDQSFGPGGGGVYELPAPGAYAALNAVTRDSAGRLLVAGTDIGPLGGLATFGRLSAAGVPDAGFGNAGLLRVPATESGADGGDGVGAAALAAAGGGETVAVGTIKSSGQRIAALWALTPDGRLDPAVGTDGRVLVPPTTSDGTALRGVAVTPDGTLVVGGANSSFSGSSVGTATRLNGFGAPAPPDTGAGEDPVLTPPSRRTPAKLSVLSAAIRGTRLRVLGTVSGYATGTLRLTYRSHGASTRLRAHLEGSDRLQVFRVERRLPARMRRGLTGRLTVFYGGSKRVRGEAARVDVAPVSPRLTVTQATIDQAGFLVASGAVGPAAKGYVEVRLVYTDARGDAVPLLYRARVARSRWTVEEKLPDAAATGGGEVSVRFGGFAPRRVRGAVLSRTVGGITQAQLRAAHSVRKP